MTINNIYAANMYQRINDIQDKIDINNAVKFQNMVKVEFNKLANMQPQEILHHIQSNNTQSLNSINNTSTLGEAIKDVRQKVLKQEKLSLLGLVNEASLQDIARATVEANNILKLAVEGRNKMQDALDKIFNINI